MENEWDEKLKRYRQKWTTPETRLLTESTLDACRKYDCMAFRPETVLPLGNMWPTGVTVETIATRHLWKCCTEQDYKVKSPTRLEAGDWNVLRAQGCFMSGQQHGVPNQGKQTDDGWEYKVVSFCDSSD